MEKVNVNGKTCHEIFKYLRCTSELWDAKKKRAKEIPWNFAKFLCDSEGKLLKYYNPRINPLMLTSDLNDYLKE